MLIEFSCGLTKQNEKFLSYMCDVEKTQKEEHLLTKIKNSQIAMYKFECILLKSIRTLIKDV